MSRPEAMSNPAVQQQGLVAFGGLVRVRAVLHREALVVLVFQFAA